jgi:drug/metabolite transporter (DMT)-like permease
VTSLKARASARVVARALGLPPVLLAAIGILLLTGMDAVLKAQMQAHPVTVAVFCRFVTGGIISLLVLAWLKPPQPTEGEVRANLIRVPLVVLTAGSFFLAVSLLPLAEAISLSFLAPCFIAVLGVVWLRERLDRSILIALACGLAGMAVMLWPKLDSGLGGSALGAGTALGVGAALFSAFAYAVNIILLRQLAMKQHPAIIVAFQNVGPALLMLPFAAWLWSWPTFADWFMFAVAGVLAVGGHLVLTYAFSKANASKIAPTEYTSLVWAALIGFFVFAEVPTLYTFAGAALIIVGSLALARR